jgi:hypothetical protein
MKASAMMTAITACLVLVSLLLAVVAGEMGSPESRDAFLRAALAVGLGGVTLIALFWMLEVRTARSRRLQ